VVAVAAQQAVHFIGMPEGRIPLAEATVYLASAPKSNSAYLAIGKAMHDVQQTRNEPPPMHLRNAPTKLMQELGYGRGYKYAHDYEGHFAAMENLPENLKGRRYYFPGALGAEREAAERLRRWWGPKYAPRQHPPAPPDDHLDGGERPGYASRQ
jgi:putative ATPase